MNSPVSRSYADGPFGQVHYRRAGTVGAPVMLLLHQAPSCSVMYEPLMQALSPHYLCLAPDFPGFGQSDPAPVPNTVAQYAQAAEAVLAAEAVSRCYAFGHHSGAAVAAALAATLDAVDVARLVLSGPPLVDDAFRDALLDSVRDIPLDGDGGHLRQMWQRIRGKAGDDVPLSLSQREVLLALDLGTLYSEAYRAILSFPLAEALSRIECPTLLLAGDSDVLRDSLEPASHLLNHSRTLIIENAATYVCEQNANDVARSILEFCDDG